jgi:hypothetical protein
MSKPSVVLFQELKNPVVILFGTTQNLNSFCICRKV